MAVFKKSSRSRSSRPFYKRSRFRRRFLPVLAVVAALSVLGGFWFLSQLGPKKINYQRDASSVDEQPATAEEVEALRQQSLRLEQDFDQISATREPKTRDIELLKEALDLQEEYLDRVAKYDAEGEIRRDDLAKRYQGAMAVQLLTESSAAEMQAERFAEVGELLQAEEKLREAFLKQQTINERFPLSSAYNVGRVARLERRVQFFKAEPLYREILAAESRAEALVEEQKWPEAEQALGQAIQLQDRLNRDYRGMKQASPLRLEQLKGKLSAIQAGQGLLVINEISAQAEAKQVSGQYLEAASLYEEAARLQTQLNQEHSTSSVVSSARVSELLRKKETAESFQLGQEIERAEALLQSALRDRRVPEALEVVASLRRNLQQMKETFPLSSLNDEELAAKVRYLSFVQTDLGFIQKFVDSNLLPIPGSTAVSMLKSEVPQALYALVMGTNPSRDQSDVKPVESVSWTETQSFCERLEWILGREVRLPTEDEFRQALGPLRYLVLEEYAWSVSDAAGAVHPVAQKKAFSSGFYDLLGNVSEWLDSNGRAMEGSAQHIGGDFEARIESIFKVPVAEMSQRGRSRTVGFRFVVYGD